MCSLHSTGYLHGVIITCCFSQLPGLHSLSFFLLAAKSKCMPPISIKDATLLQTNQSQRLPIERKKKRPYSFSFQGDQGINIGRPCSFPSLSCLLFLKKFCYDSTNFYLDTWNLNSILYSYENCR